LADCAIAGVVIAAQIASTADPDQNCLDFFMKLLPVMAAVQLIIIIIRNNKVSYLGVRDLSIGRHGNATARMAAFAALEG
jgi:hypothetical protein